MFQIHQKKQAKTPLRSLAIFHEFVWGVSNIFGNFHPEDLGFDDPI